VGKENAFDVLTHRKLDHPIFTQPQILEQSAAVTETTAR
jgi:hypothetical protein